MPWKTANAVVEELRAETQLYLPALSKRRGFSSTRVEHLLNRLVREMPENERYLEIGTLEGRTLESAAMGNPTKRLVGVDPCEKYEMLPEGFPQNVTFVQTSWQTYLTNTSLRDFGVVFYDGLHSAEETEAFMRAIAPRLASEAVLVLDDWDRISVRTGAFAAATDEWWRLLREMPEYGDGLTCPQSHFGWSFGISVWGFRR